MINYTPRSDSLAAQVVAFFRANPDERLTADDVAQKWDVNRKSVHTLLARSLDVQLLQREQSTDGEWIYAAGAMLPMTAVPEPKPARSSKAFGFSSPRHAFDLDAAEVEEDVPYMPGGIKGQSKWGPLFDKLEKPGQSIAIPGQVKSAVAAAAIKRNAEKRGTFRVQMTGPDAARVWRVA